MATFIHPRKFALRWLQTGQTILKLLKDRRWFGDRCVTAFGVFPEQIVR
jgi:hypothetical protein